MIPGYIDRIAGLCKYLEFKRKEFILDWDKQNIIAIVLGVALMVLWFIYGPEIVGGKDSPAPPAAASVQTVNASAAAPVNTAVKAPVAAPSAAKIKAMAPVVISNGDSKYQISPLSGVVEKVILDDKFLKNDRSGALELVNVLPDFAKASADYGTFGLRSEHGLFQVVRVLQNQKLNDSTYLLVRILKDAQGNEFTCMSKYEALKGYRLKVSFQLVNSGKKAVAFPALTVSAGDLQPWYRMTGDDKSKSQELHSIEYCTSGGKVKSEEVAADNDDWAELNGNPVRWAGVTNRFFAMLLKSKEAAKLHVDRAEEPAGSEEFIAHVSAVLNTFTLAPGAAKDLEFEYYLGPKYPRTLEAFDADASDVMHLGWFPIDFLAYIMLWMLNWLYGFVGSFGWSIILLTLLIRTIFFPVTMKANASMREMQALSPKLKEIREKYKDEPMVAQTKMSELYREHKVNPLGGCLPMIIQIPVFIALYYALGSAAELRQQSFWWINDLAQPDTVATVCGVAINPLIIAWTLLMVLQQKLTPTAMDPMQAKMMLAMPLVMLFILYSLPAALTLYWTVSQIFGILQMMYQNKLKKRDDARRQEKAAQEKSPEKPKTVRS